MINILIYRLIMAVLGVIGVYLVRVPVAIFVGSVFQYFGLEDYASVPIKRKRNNHRSRKKSSAK